MTRFAFPRTLFRTACALALAAALAAPAAAEIYRYKAPDGRWVISNSPPVDGTAPQTDLPEGQSRSESPALTALPAPGAPVPEPAPAKARRRPDSDALAFGKSTDYVKRHYHYYQGVVRNRSSDATLQFVHITIKLFGSGGQLLGVETAYTQPTHLAPGQEGTYSIMAEHNPAVSTYQTSANWKEQLLHD